jgi:uncharacterized protein YqcC (DUF446 family)
LTLSDLDHHLFVRKFEIKVDKHCKTVNFAYAYQYIFLPNVSLITAVDLPDGISVIPIVHEAICNDTANHSFLSEFQLRDFGVKIE